MLLCNGGPLLRVSSRRLVTTVHVNREFFAIPDKAETPMPPAGNDAPTAKGVEMPFVVIERHALGSEPFGKREQVSEVRHT